MNVEIEHFFYLALHGILHFFNKKLLALALFSNDVFSDVDYMRLYF